MKLQRFSHLIVTTVVISFNPVYFEALSDDMMVKVELKFVLLYLPMSSLNVLKCTDLDIMVTVAIIYVKNNKIDALSLSNQSETENTS